jgi:SSS family solute:Na+ symporter
MNYPYIKSKISFLLRVVFCVMIFNTLSFLFLKADNFNALHQTNVFSMETLDDPTLREGLAGNFFGKQGSWFLMAGGSSFPEGKPWENGVKQYSDRVFVFSQQADGTFRVVYEGNDLPVALAEGSYASLPGGLLCMGGQTPEGITGEVWLLSFDGASITATEYPPLPTPVKHSTATVIGSRVYLLGGELADGSSSSQFLVLDLNNLAVGWKRLPDFPVPVSGSAIASQQDGEEVSLFVFGGRAKNNNDITTFYSSVYHFRPSAGTWNQKQNMQIKNGPELPLAMATASSVGGSHILLYGGDNGTIFNQVEAAINSGEGAKRDSLQSTHPGFNNKILLYNTITDAWFEAGETNNPPVAVTADVSDGSNVYIASGEIRPGVRSPHITQLHYTSRSSFGWLNYLVLLVYFGGMLWIGFFFMKRNENTEDFFKASGRIPWWAAGISIFATTLSAITFLSIPAKTYATDWRMLIFNIAIILIVPFVIKYFIPFFRRFNLGTAYEYLEMRFSRAVRWLASALFVIFMVSRIAIVLFLPALALNAVTGFDIYLSIIVMGIVTIIYSTSGGMEAVVWGDVVQGFILVFGAITAFVVMIVGIEGGIGEFWSTSIEFHKFRTFDFRFDFTQPVIWVVLIGGVANSMITYTSDQSIVQRYMSTKDEKATARSIWLNGILSVPVTILFFLIGTGLFAFYADNPASMSVTNPNIDSVFPQFIVSEMPAGFAGLLIAAIFAAAMSTLSSNINSSAAVITSDFFQTVFPKSSFTSRLKVARWSGILCGLLGLGMALVLATWNIASLWDQFNTFLGLLTSGLGALFILGVFFPRVDSKAALIGVIGGLIVLVFIKNNTPFSFLLYGFFGMAASIVIAVAMSWFSPNKKKITGLTWKTICKIPLEK